MTQQTVPSCTASSPPRTYWCRDHRGREYEYEEALDLIRDFHGFAAPGLVVGVRMVTLAMACLAEDTTFDAICETRTCLPDAVQMLTLCTIGNGWLQVIDLGRFGLTLYDKTNGQGTRVFLDSAKLKKWPEFYNWFYKIKSKKEQDLERLMDEIRHSGEDVLTLKKVQVSPPYLGKHGKGSIGTCSLCSEAYPSAHGEICKGCQGETPYEETSGAVGIGG